MKSARQWVGHLPGQFGGWGEAELQDGGYLDADGWPMRIPPELTKIETFMLTDFPEDATQHAGVYRLTYEGSGKLDVIGRARPIRYGENEIWLRFTPGDGFLGFAISETDPENTGDYIRNVSVVREDQIDLFEAGVVFNPDWVNVVRDVRLVRFMDWMFTNGAEVSTWNQRPKPQDYSFASRGVPLELMVDLVNHIGADPWFNMPHKADDSYVRMSADYVRKHLRQGLLAHVEYSNEIWNFLFPQAHWSVAQAESRWGDAAGEDAWMQFAGARAAEVVDIWSDVFAGQEHRLKRVVATHTGWPGLEDAILSAPLAVANGARQPVESFDAYAVTGYFGYALGTDEWAPQILTWLQESPTDNQGKQEVITKVIDQIRTSDFKELTEITWPYQAEVAQRNGLELIMYEGGTHIVGLAEWTGNEELTRFFTQLNYAPEMAKLYRDLLSAWTAIGGTVFNAFVDVARPTQWGSWGARRHLADSNPRQDALFLHNLAGAAWQDMRDAEAFRSGQFSQGGDEADQFKGTDLPDIFLGGAGDDEFFSGGGDDILHGGLGVDHAELSGFLEEYRFFTDLADPKADGIQKNAQKLRAEGANGQVVLVDIETLSFSKTPDLIIQTSDLF